MSLFGVILALLLPDFTIYHGILCNYEYLFFGLIFALLLPGLTVSVCESSCNYISFGLILDLLRFRSRESRENDLNETEQDNYMNCRTHKL